MYHLLIIRSKKSLYLHITEWNGRVNPGEVWNRLESNQESPSELGERVRGSLVKFKSK